MLNKKIIALLGAALLAQNILPAVPSLVSTVQADESASSTIFRILTDEGGLNSAAACGILGNIQQECEFDPTAYTGRFYGLAQWSGGRIDELRSFCSENGYDSESVEGQAHFIVHELQNSFSYVYDALASVPDTAEGAYTASCTFCHDYEQCGNYDWEYSTRGGYTETFWDSYGGSTADETGEDTSDEYVSDDEDEETVEDENVDDESVDDENVDDESVEDENVDDENVDDENVDDESAEDDGEDESSDEEDEESGSRQFDDSAYSDDVYQELLSGNYDTDLIFDYDYYVDRYPEVTEEAGSDYSDVLHYFLTRGVTNGQRGSQNFSVLNYQQNYSDLYDQYADEYPYYYLHYLKHGYDMGFTGAVSDEQQAREEAEEKAEQEWQEYLDSPNGSSDAEQSEEEAESADGSDEQEESEDYSESEDYESSEDYDSSEDQDESEDYDSYEEY